MFNLNRVNVEVTKEMKVYLCGEKGCCPSVEVGNDFVEIGENENKCKLTMQEWTDLKTRIKNNEL